MDIQEFLNEKVEGSKKYGYLQLKTNKGNFKIKLDRKILSKIDEDGIKFYPRIKRGKPYFFNTKVGYIHRFVMKEFGENIDSNDMIDHKNQDTCDNTFANLRVTNRSQNSHNITRFNIYWHKHNKKYCAEITNNGKKRTIGYFDTEKEAKDAYIKAARETRGEYHPFGEEKMKLKDLLNLKEEELSHRGLWPGESPTPPTAQTNMKKLVLKNPKIVDIFKGDSHGDDYKYLKTVKYSDNNGVSRNADVVLMTPDNPPKKPFKLLIDKDGNILSKDQDYIDNLHGEKEEYSGPRHTADIGLRNSENKLASYIATQKNVTRKDGATNITTGNKTFAGVAKKY